MPAVPVAADIHLVDIEAAINWWLAREAHDGLALPAAVRPLADVYARMIHQGRDRWPAADLAQAAMQAWLAWYETTPDAPCIAICSTSQGDAVCKGCGRRFDEVQHWVGMDPVTKRDIWRRITVEGTAWRFQRYADRARVGAESLGVVEARRPGATGGVARAAALAFAVVIGTLSTGSPSWAQDRSAGPYVDVTTTHLPQAPDLHAVDAVMVDVDGDADLDVVVAVEGGPNALYRNEGRGRLVWQPGVFGDQAADNEHVRAADFNGDGHVDLVFVAEDDERTQLFLGDGCGGFTDASATLPGGSQGNGLAVGDVNGDGLPDIVIGNTPEGKREPARNFLWLNDSRKPGQFIDVTGTHLPRTEDHAQGIALADLDGDGDLDMVVANQSPPNRLLLNDGQGRFTDASERLELKTPLETREVHVFDANRDGHPDIVFFNLTSNNRAWDKDPQTRLLVNDGQGRFRDETAARLPQHRFSSWGGTVIDFNGDGAPDLLVSAIQVPGFVPLQVRAWQNDGQGRFEDVTLTVMPSATVGRGWSMAQGDLDGDGRADVFIGGWRSQARLLLTDRAAAGPRRPVRTPPLPLPQASPQASPQSSQLASPQSPQVAQASASAQGQARGEAQLACLTR